MKYDFDAGYIEDNATHEEIMKQAIEKYNYRVNVFEDISVACYLHPEIEWIKLVGPYSLCNFGYEHENPAHPLQMLVCISHEVSEAEKERMKQNILRAYRRMWNDKWIEIYILTGDEYCEETTNVTTAFDDETPWQRMIRYSTTKYLYIYGKGNKLTFPEWFEYDIYLKYRKDDYVFE